MKEVYPGIFLIREQGRLKALKPPENVYVIAGYNGLIYDAGYGDLKNIKFLYKEIKKIEKFYKERDEKFKITSVLPSHAHADHFSGLMGLRKYLGVKIILTEKTAEIIKNKHTYQKFFKANIYEDYLRVKTVKGRIREYFENFGSYLFYNKIFGIKYVNDADLIIEADSEIQINGEKWKIFPSPGHTPDHISLYNKDKGILFSGDNILKEITTWLGPPDSNIEDYIKSIKRIQELPNLKIILSAHGSPITNPKERIAEILKHREERTQQILRLIKKNANHGISPTQIVRKLYLGSSRMIRQMARGWVVLTLKMLEKKYLIKRSILKKEIRFYPR
jgi:glyoxylase-like metal-dependent hydrolase (beta-lactamase superfamily II)